MDMKTFDKLPKEFKRGFISDNFDFKNLEEILKIYNELEDRTVTSLEEFETWIGNLFEFEVALHEAHGKLYILSTCHTDDENIKREEKYFTNTIFPGIAEITNKINDKILTLYKNLKPSSKRYGIFIRSIEAEKKLFCKENIPLFVKIDNFSQKYFEIRGGMMIDFKGKSRTMSEMFKFLESPDKNIRKEAWLIRNEKNYENREEINNLYSEIVKLHHKKAINAGFNDNIEYTFLSKKRFDYTPEDSIQFHNSIEKSVVPILTKIHKEKCEKMGVDKLKPWDIFFDYRGDSPLKPFETVDELVEKTIDVMYEIDEKFGNWTKMMRDYKLLDLDSRKGKAPGGYSSTLTETRLPFIFMNVSGTDWDIRTLFHELGHSFHSLSKRDDILNYNSPSPMEFNEVSSMAMEFLGNSYLEKIYDNSEDVERSRKRHFERVVALFTSVAAVDAFQHWIYSNPNHTVEEREEKWLEIGRRFDTGMVDWTGYEKFRKIGWQSILHIITMPFYYIEYGIAQIGALQVWANSKKNFEKSIEDYKNGLSAGNGFTLPELFEKSGIKFDFSEKMLQNLMNEIVKVRW